MMLRIIVFVILSGSFPLSFCAAQQNSTSAGKLIYVSVDPVSYSIDSLIVYYSPGKIELISKPGEESKTSAYRRIADLAAGRQYWIFDEKKIVLEEKIPNELPRRLFEEMDGNTQVQNISTRTFVSNLAFKAPSDGGLEEFIQKLSVAGGTQRLVDTALYLVDFGFYRGRLIIKNDTEAFFKGVTDNSRKLTYTLMSNEETGSDTFGQMPAGYTVRPMSLHEFQLALERIEVYQLVRFYLDGSLKN